MRQHYRVAVYLAIPVILLLSIRHHLRDLSEVARTYGTFKALKLDTYTYPPPGAETELANQSPNLAPKILHQIFLQEGRNSTLAKYQPARESCVTLHPEWQHMLWTDDNATDFVQDHYPEVLPHYVRYAQTIQRTNILRYLLLHHYGGVYLDLDITCRVPLDSFQHLPWVTPGAYPAGINNAFILSKPQHPFVTGLIERIPHHDLHWPLPYVENMLSTGCMFITNAWMAYMRHQEEHAWEDKVFVLADADGSLEGQMLRGKIITPVFEHGGASSWHGWDAEAIVLIGKYYGYAMLGFGGLVLALVASVGLSLTRYSRRRRLSRQLDEEKAAYGH